MKTIAVFCVLLSLLGCATTGTRTTQGNRDGRASLTLRGEDIAIIRFDGNAVEWYAPNPGSLEARIAPGPHTFLMSSPTGAIEMTAVFVSGKDYEVKSNSGALYFGPVQSGEIVQFKRIVQPEGDTILVEASDGQAGAQGIEADN
jgi:hypothetical protein